MISKNKLKYIHALEHKKTRRQEGVFVAEGSKCVGDLINARFIPKYIACTDDWEIPTMLKNASHIPDIDRVTQEELRKASFLQHPQQIIAIFPIPSDVKLPQSDTLRDNLFLALDGVQDPGNMGTIIRIADWFGINTIICSRDTVDAYSPKVVQATMGSIARVNVIYTDLNEFLSNLPADIPIYGTLLDGNNIYSTPLSHNGLIIMGNEGNGISSEIRKKVNHKILIPSFPPNEPTAESLNVSIATAITIAEFRRQASLP